MKAAAAVLALVLVHPAVAAAQMSPLPHTITLKDKSGNLISTITVWDGRGYLRDSKGDLLGTLVNNADGTQTFYDPNGKIVPMPKLPQQ